MMKVGSILLAGGISLGAHALLLMAMNGFIDDWKLDQVEKWEFSKLEISLTRVESNPTQSELSVEPEREVTPEVIPEVVQPPQPVVVEAQSIVEQETPMVIPEPVPEPPAPPPLTTVVEPEEEVRVAEQDSNGAVEASHITNIKQITFSENVVKPQYPMSARRRGAQGTVVLLATINSQGTVEEVSVEESSGHRDLDTAAIKAFKRAQFKVSMSSDETIIARAPIRFMLK